MTCDRIRPLLSDYHDDALSPRQRARVRAHVATCASCLAALEGYDRLYAALRQAPLSVPPGLRRDVYASIARLDGAHGRSLVPFAGPGVWGALRAAGGTAGLLAVLGGLVFAAMHVASAPGAVRTTVTAQGITAAEDATKNLMSALGADRTTSLPPAAQTAIAPMRTTFAGAAAWTVGKGTAHGSDVSVPVQGVQRAASGAPHTLVRARADVLSRATPIVSHFSVESAVPVPTIAPDEGLVYLRLQSPNALRPVRATNSWADIRFHTLAPGAPPIELAPHAADQLLTGLTAARDGRAIAYSAMGQAGAGGIFALDLVTRRTASLLPFPDVSPLGKTDWPHRYVKQVYTTVDGPLLFTTVDNTNGRMAVTIAMTTSGGLTRTVAPVKDPWFDYVVSPDHHYIAWTKDPDARSGVGALEVSTLDTHPTTVTVGRGAHPVWSPDSSSLLYEGDDPPGLYVWSAHKAPRRVVTLGSVEASVLGDFAWAPNGRFFAYVQSTLEGGTSTVSLGDADTGYTWPAFRDAWIGSIAWAHAPATTAAPVVMATPTAPPTATTAGSTTGAGAPSEPITGVPASPHLLFDNTDSPVAVVHSFYNAINRHEYQRAYSYLSFLPGDVRDFRRFAGGYAATQAVTLTALQPAPYINGANFNATTCVAFALTSHDASPETTGAVKHYGGWYMVRSTTGQAPVYGGWRIVMDGTHSTLGGRATVPPQARCVVPSRGRATRPAGLPPSQAGR